MSFAIEFTASSKAQAKDTLAGNAQVLKGTCPKKAVDLINAMVDAMPDQIDRDYHISTYGHLEVDVTGRPVHNECVFSSLKISVNEMTRVRVSEKVELSASDIGNVQDVFK